MKKDIQVLGPMDLVAPAHDVTSAAKSGVKHDVKKRLLGLRAESCDAHRRLSIGPEWRGRNGEIEPSHANARRRRSGSGRRRLRALLADTRVPVRLALKLVKAALIADTGVRSRPLLRSRS
jgi:hypothetical protein